MGGCTCREKLADTLPKHDPTLTSQKTSMLEQYLSKVAEAKQRQQMRVYSFRVVGENEGKVYKADRAITTSTLEDTNFSPNRPKWDLDDSSEAHRSDSEESEGEEAEHSSDQPSISSRLEELRHIRSDRIAKARLYRP